MSLTSCRCGSRFLSPISMSGNAEAGRRSSTRPPFLVNRQSILQLPRSYETESTVIMVTNSLGGNGWNPVFSRLRVFEWDPLVDEQIEDLRTWAPPVPEAVLEFIEQCHKHGEILSLDYRRVVEAAESLRLDMPWKDDLRSSFFTSSDTQVQQDANEVLDWLKGKQAKPGRASPSVICTTRLQVSAEANKRNGDQ